jgi:hypothetical protein
MSLFATPFDKNYCLKTVLNHFIKIIIITVVFAVLGPLFELTLATISLRDPFFESAICCNNALKPSYSNVLLLNNIKLTVKSF